MSSASGYNKFQILKHIEILKSLKGNILTATTTRRGHGSAASRPRGTRRMGPARPGHGTMKWY